MHSYENSFALATVAFGFFLAACGSGIESESKEFGVTTDSVLLANNSATSESALGNTDDEVIAVSVLNADGVDVVFTPADNSWFQRCRKVPLFNGHVLRK